MKNLQKAAAVGAIVVLTGGVFAETELEKLDQMRMQPTNSLYNQAMAARVPDAVATDNETAPVSLTAVPVNRPRKYKKHDLVSIIVRQDSEASTNATADQKRKQDFDLALQQFLELGRFAGTAGIGNVASPGKLPEIKFKFDNSRNADASTERKDHMAMRVTAEVVDVKPNGTLVLEAVAHIRHDREEQTIRLSGIARAEDVTVDNTVLSTQLAKLSLSKDTEGEVRDGTKRSWINKVIDKVGP